MFHGPLLAPTPHAFTGVADGDFRPGRPGQPDTAARLVARLGGTGALRIVNQVHGAEVVHVDAIDAAWPAVLDADAIVSTRPGVVIAVRTADCVPILVAGPGGVAAIHAGWRGTAADVARAGVAALCAATGCRASDLRAVVGPCISGAMYEVGAEVVPACSGVAPRGGAPWFHVGPAGREHVDLARLNANILADLGVQVDVLGLCTASDRRLWSHRRDGEPSGRQVAAIRWG